VEVVDAKARRQSTKPWGQTLWFYRGDGCKEASRLDLHAYHDLLQCHTLGYAHAIPILSCGKIVGCCASPSGPGLVTSKRNIDQKCIYGPFRPRSPMVGPSMGPTATPNTPTKGGKS
jgi:hypothetical protein